MLTHSFGSRTGAGILESMVLLAVDTSSGAGSLALARDGENGWIECSSLPEEWKSTTLHTELQTLLSRRGLKTSDVDAYAVATGPGTFTGLRIGLTAVKGLAEVHQKPVIPVSTLELIAIAAQEGLPHAFAGSLAPLFDARRGQVFAALYQVNRDFLSALVAESVGSLASFLEKVKASGASDVRFCTPDTDLFAHEIERAGWDAASVLAPPATPASLLACVGTKRLREGRGIEAVAVDANYVRASDAELFWKG